MKPRVTLADIARKAGVSKAAVSMALRQHPRIGAAQRERIARLARSLGYRADPALARIAAARWKNHAAPAGTVIAYVQTPRPPATRSVPDPPEFLAARERGRALGYQVELFDSADYPGPERLGSTLWNRGIQGLVVAQIYDPGFVARFPWKHFAAVALHDGDAVPPVEQFTPDFLHAFRECWRQIGRRGYRRPGLLLFREQEDNYINFVLSAALRELHATTPWLEAAIPVHHLDEDGAPAALAWAREHRPDVLIGLNDAHYWRLHEAGLRFPRDHAFVSLLRMPLRGTPVAGMTISLAALGVLALERVDSMLRYGVFGAPEHPVAHRVEGVWRDGRSLPPRARPAPSPRRRRA